MSRLQEIQELIESIDWTSGWESEARRLRRVCCDLASEIDNINHMLDIGECTLSGPGRGDCEHFVGLHGLGSDEYCRPDGWCWSCWRQKQIELLFKEKVVDVQGLANHLMKFWGQHSIHFSDLPTVAEEIASYLKLSPARGWTDREVEELAKILRVAPDKWWDSLDRTWPLVKDMYLAQARAALIWMYEMRGER